MALLRAIQPRAIHRERPLPPHTSGCARRTPANPRPDAPARLRRAQRDGIASEVARMVRRHTLLDRRYRTLRVHARCRRRRFRSVRIPGDSNLARARKVATPPHPDNAKLNAPSYLARYFTGGTTGTRRPTATAGGGEGSVSVP